MLFFHLFLLRVRYSFQLLISSHLISQGGPLVTAAAKNKADVDGAGQLEVEQLKKDVGMTEDTSTSLLEKREGNNDKGDLDRASELAPTHKYDLNSVAQDGNEKGKNRQAVTGEVRATSEVVVSRHAAQARLPRSHRPHRPLQPLRQYPGPRTGHLYKPHAVVLLDGTFQIVWYPK